MVQQSIERPAAECQDENGIRLIPDSKGSTSPNENRTGGTDTMPEVHSINDLHAFGEAITAKDGGSQVKFTFVCFIDDNDNAYFGQAHASRFDLTPQVIQKCLKRVPDGEIYPKKPADIIIFSFPISEDLYIKRPDLKSWDDFEGTDFLPRLLLGEVEAFELLRRNPHPNIAQYHGCIVNRGRITGIVLDRYQMTLEQRLEENTSDFNKEASFKDIESALKHLYSLGLAHNDLNPANIMLDGHDQPFIIDFGSCKPLGSRLMEAGTKGWIEDHSYTSEIRHDEIALRNIWAWMGKKTASQQSSS